VWTMDPAHPRVQAVAWRGDQVVAVGDDAAVRALAAASTRIIDLHGRSATPGLVDAHCHLYGLGTDLENVSVRGLDSEAATVAVMAGAAKTRPASQWLIGRGWDQKPLAGAAVPDARRARRRDLGSPGRDGADRRPRDLGQLGRAARGRDHPGDAGAAGRQDRPRRAGRTDRRPDRQRRGPGVLEATCRQPGADRAPPASRVRRGDRCRIDRRARDGDRRGDRGCLQEARGRPPACRCTSTPT